MGGSDISYINDLDSTITKRERENIYIKLILSFIRRLSMQDYYKMFICRASVLTLPMPVHTDAAYASPH